MKKRVETNAPHETLRHNPFAGLGGAVPENLPEQPAAPEEAVRSGPVRPWVVGKTRKGGFAISIERRAKGKVVTVLRNVSGDADALLRELKKRCGAGGVVREDAVELQGNHQAAVVEFLKT